MSSNIFIFKNGSLKTLTYVCFHIWPVTSHRGHRGPACPSERPLNREQRSDGASAHDVEHHEEAKKPTNRSEDFLEDPTAMKNRPVWAENTFICLKKFNLNFLCLSAIIGSPVHQKTCKEDSLVTLFLKDFLCKHVKNTLFRLSTPSDVESVSYYNITGPKSARFHPRCHFGLLFTLAARDLRNQ